MYVDRVITDEPLIVTGKAPSDPGPSKRKVNCPAGSVTTVDVELISDTPARGWPPFVALTVPLMVVAAGAGGVGVGVGVGAGEDGDAPHADTRLPHISTLRTCFTF